jgi:PAS domain S-box-containing protein
MHIISIHEMMIPLLIAGTLAIIVLLSLCILNYYKNSRGSGTQLLNDDLFAEKNLLKTLIDNAPDMLYMKDRDSRFVLANKQVAMLMGESDPQSLIGKTDNNFYDPDLAAKFFRDEQTIMSTGQPIINAIEPRLSEDGKTVHVLTSKIPIKDSHGKVVGIIGISRDISHMIDTESKLRKQTEHLKTINLQLNEKQEEVRKQSEELKAQADYLTQINHELKRSNATKDKFFSIIAHDLRNPFFAISSFTDLLQKNYVKMQEVEKQEIIDMISIASENAYNLLENLLQWARSQTDSVKFMPMKVDLNSIIQQNIRLLKVSARKKNISLKTLQDEPFEIIADPNMLEAIIRNLISNAIKFTDTNGEVVVSYRETKDSAEISVADNGVGIDDETKLNLFRMDKFHGTSGTAGEAGTGIGLIVCKEFIDKHHGSIWVKSIPGEGTTITFTLPKRQ